MLPTCLSRCAPVSVGQFGKLSHICKFVTDVLALKHMYYIVYRLHEIKLWGHDKFMNWLAEISTIAKSIIASLLLDILLHPDYKRHIKQYNYCVVAFSIGLGRHLLKVAMYQHTLEPKFIFMWADWMILVKQRYILPSSLYLKLLGNYCPYPMSGKASIWSQERD